MNPSRKINLAARLLSQGHAREAAELTQRLLAAAPSEAAVHHLAADVAMAEDRPARALEHIETAIGLDPANSEHRLRKAGIQVILRRGLDAQETASELAGLHPDNPRVQLAVAQIFSNCGNHAGAETFLENITGHDRNSREFLSRFATNQFFLGKTDSAERAVAEYLALDPPRIGSKLLIRSALRKQTPERNHVQDLRAYLDRDLPPEEAVYVYFALAKELEDLGEYRSSFDMLRAGSSTRKRSIRYDPAGEIGNIRDVMRVFQPAEFAAIPESGSRESPVFIVGMPRTGTTLVERLVSAHGGVRSAEETYDFTLAFSSVINETIAANPGQGLSPLSAALKADYDEIARRYLRNMHGMLGDAAMYLDKTPFNFLYCGLIGKAFPRARIIHLVRNPMDTCYAVFKTLFSRAYYYSYDLDDLADYYVVYRRLMDHWHSLMPDAILDVGYEALVSDPVAVSRRIADFVGIPWSEAMVAVQDSDAACSTASAAQVREPIYTTSVGLWRNLEAGMEPVRLKLAAAGLVDEKGDALPAGQPV